MALQEVLEEQGYARLIDVANKLNISKGSLSTSLKPLIRKELITEDSHKHLGLSPKGEMFAKHIQNNHKIVFGFLHNTLKIDKKDADIDACKIEHLLSWKSAGAIEALSKVLEENPKLHKELLQKISEAGPCPSLAAHKVGKVKKD